MSPRARLAAEHRTPTRTRPLPSPLAGRPTWATAPTPFVAIAPTDCAATTITANALHPGWPLKTNLGREQHGPGGAFDKISKRFGSSAANGARTSLHLASSPAVAGANGGYYAKCKPATSSKLSHDEDTARQLWHRSAQLCGMTTPAS